MVSRLAQLHERPLLSALWSASRRERWQAVSEHELPTISDYEAAGFTEQQALMLGHLNLAILEMINDGQKQFSQLLDRLSPSAWLTPESRKA